MDYTDFLAAIEAGCLDANIAAADGNLTREWIAPAAYYLPQGTYVWDLPFSTRVAIAFGRAVQAQGWIDAILDHQDAMTGFVPQAVAPAAIETRITQSNQLAWAALALYNSSGDSVWLASVYPKLEAYYAWWEANRQDASGLATYGSSDGTLVWAGIESGEDKIALWESDYHQAMSGTLMTLMPPSLNAMLVLEAESLRQIAVILGETADAATYATKRDTRKAAMNLYMWDDMQGCYQSVARAADAITGFSVSGAHAQGAMTINVTVGGTGLFAKGDKFVIGGSNITCQVADYTLLSPGVNAVPLAVGLSGVLVGGEACSLRRMVTVKWATNHFMPLLAGVPSQAQADRIVAEHLLKQFDGSESETMVIKPGSGFYKNRHLYIPPGLEWRHVFASEGYNTFDAFGQTSNPGAVGESRLMMRVYYKGADFAAAPFGNVGNAFSDWFYTTSYESASATYPVAVKVYWIKNADVAPQIRFWRFTDTAFLTTAQLVGAGSVGEEVSATYTFEGPEYIQYFDVMKPDSATALKVTRIEITTKPRGFQYRSPFGMITSPRLGGNGFALTVNDPTGGGVGINDYWRGDHWPQEEYMCCHALVRYGYQAEAELLAQDSVDRTYQAWLGTDIIWERFGMRGNGKGAENYTWGGLAANMIEEFSVGEPAGSGSGGGGGGLGQSTYFGRYIRSRG